MRTVKGENSSSTAVYTLRVDRDKLARIHEIAAAEHRSLTGKLRQMIDEEIAAHRSTIVGTDADPAAAGALPAAAPLSPTRNSAPHSSTLSSLNSSPAESGNPAHVARPRAARAARGGGGGR